jgi:hypothetical protein
MVTLDYETPQKRSTGSDRWGRRSSWMVVLSVGVLLLGADMSRGYFVTAIIVLSLGGCCAIAGIVFGVVSLRVNGASWPAIVGVCINSLIVVLISLALTGF